MFKRDFRKTDTLRYFLVKEMEPTERQSLSREVVTKGAGSWGKEGDGGHGDDS